MTAGIRNIMVITNETDLENFKRVLGDGSQFGIHICYRIQYVQRGIADAFLIAEDFIDDDDVCLILGDNIFYGPSVDDLVSGIDNGVEGAMVFSIRVRDPERFGVIEYGDNERIISIEEKPRNPKSDYAAAGLYFYDKEVCKLAKELKPSARGELEIIDLNRIYLSNGRLKGCKFDENTKWIDAGTFDSLLESSQFVRDEERSLSRKVMCPEIIAFEKGFISREKLLYGWIPIRTMNTSAASGSNYSETLLPNKDALITKNVLT